MSNCRNVLPSGKEIDIYIPSNKLAIEFDGLYWHNELNKDKDYHLNKTIECEKFGIKLIHIFEDEWINKREIIISFFKKLLGVSDVSIKAEQCVVKLVNKIDSEKFLEENYIQGCKQSSVRCGLYQNNELLSIMTFRKSNKNYNEYELICFCNKVNYNICGASQKLFNYFVNKCNPTCVISSIDRRFNNDDYLIDIGFQQFETIKPTFIM